MKILISLLFVASSYAGLWEATRLRELIEVKSNDHHFLVRETISLPVTKGFSQGTSQLCWAFTTAGILESNYLHAHPELGPEQVELSRWYFGRIAGSKYRRGTVFDAIYNYIPKGGVLTRNAYPKYFGKPPSSSKFLGLNYSAEQLAEEILGQQSFWSYAFSSSRQGWYRHPDPDALNGVQSMFLRPEDKPKLLKMALESGNALGYTYGGHVILLYGVKLDSDGNALSYLVKDSYAPYFYEASASKVHRNGFEFTTKAELIAYP